MALRFRRGIDSDFTLSDGTTTVRQFAEGEPVFNTTSNVLYIGTDSDPVAIIAGTTVETVE